MDDDRDDPGPGNPNVRGRKAHRGARGGGFRGRGNNNNGRRLPRDRMVIDRRPQRPGHQVEAMQYDNRGPRDRSDSRQRLQPQYGRGNQNHRGHNHYRGSRENISQRNQNNRNDNQPRVTKPLGLKKLEGIAKSEQKETLGKLMEFKNPFLEILKSPIEQFDYFVLITEILAKVARSSFDETKSKMLLDICNSNYILTFKSYLIDLPYTKPQAKQMNNLYWGDPETFWRNFVEFCDCIVNTSPSLAISKCRSLLEATSISCLDGLKKHHNFTMPEECSLKMEALRERLADFEKINEVARLSKRHRPEDGAPPENFRELSLMPTREDLLHRRPFIRPNITNGGYDDVEHYLDVQFRLLREDCFGPLRVGLNQYLNDEQRKKYDNIRVFHNVKFSRPYVSQTRIGSLVQLDVRNNKMFKRTNWSNNKRFIYGSLVLFTKDNCKTFKVATILDREEELLARGMIPVSIIGQEFDVQLYNDDSYIMIESEVYYEPYYLVLKVLQDPTFPQHLPMKQYIIHANPEPKPPSYLTIDTKFSVVNEDQTREDRAEAELDDLIDLILQAEDKEKTEVNVNFNVLQDDTWPDRAELGFDDSQYEAYKLALTHEFAVIQGPPGTGKTYLGIKVAKTLFENLKSTEGCLMLVICYTNHALDQFLEALMDITESIVRIGGQSRNEAMNEINIIKLRKTMSIHSNANRACFDQKIELKNTITGFQKALVRLDILLNGVPRVKTIENAVGEIEFLVKYYKDSGYDPLYHWLFEHNNEFFTHDIGFLFDEYTADDAVAKHEKETRKRTGVVLDDLENANLEAMKYRREFASFSIETATTDIKELVSKYRKTDVNNVHARGIIERELQLIYSLIVMFNEMSKHRQRRINIRIGMNTNFGQIAPIDRWSLYFRWVADLTRDARFEVGRLQERVDNATAVYEESRMMLDMQVLKETKIIGMTTSGAARMRKLLQTLDPPIVIVEEAAEVLEQHIITSLTEGCKHLILIGDHQQLRPSASYMKLAKHYQLEVSLFERMINNGVDSRRLGVQHRMRPEIAALICPHIYPQLENHPSVYDFPDVMGITKNIFFFTHEFKEDVVDDNVSRTNQREADMTLGLANYLMQQGYATDDVTILAAYKGQMFYMRKTSDRYSHLKGVKITVVDNYQGEESKIILLSLVRNNDENNIGFLGIANRICVALSRAKHGFYIFGNIDTLKATSELWTNIAATLEGNESVGNKLTLQCQNHPHNMTIVEKLEDFQQAPEGGCMLRCDFVLPRCGHKCLLFCHGYDRTHTTNATRCTLKCERIQCDLNHICPKRCAEECGPCMRKVLKKLPCGHEMMIPCHLEPDDPQVKCLTTLEVTLPDCKHKAKKLCYVKIKDVRCEVKCEFRVEMCGHSCLKKCHVNDDPAHQKYLCMKNCARAKLECKADLLGDRGEHQCQKKCHETCDLCIIEILKKRSKCKHSVKVPCSTDPDTVDCPKKCTRSLPCGHFCKKKCKDPCGDCNEMVDKVIPDCKHGVKTLCKLEPTRAMCKLNCERTMNCGHRCKGVCGDMCDPSQCREPSQKEFDSPCGHRVKLPCYMAKLPADELKPEMLLSACSAPCQMELACKHICMGSCARCRQGRLHVPCTQKCNQTNICGHTCEEPCNQVCPPCKKQCEVKCSHNRCGMLCGAPCQPCKEECRRVCEHGACARRCGEVCARPPCEQPCALRLACAHACRGLCGEPCPPVCKPCHPDDFPKDFLGDPFEDTDRFIVLQDCGHVMEVENMDNLMMGDSETVKIRCCPFCRTPIINTHRYKDLVNETFKNEINPIKEKVYGTNRDILATRQKLQADLGSFRAKYMAVLEGNTACRQIYLNLLSVVKTQKSVSKLQLDMELIALNILDMIAECYKSYLESKSTELKNELTTQTKLLCNVFAFQIKKSVMFKVSEQQQADMKMEIRRLNAIVQLAKLLSHKAYVMTKSTLAVARAFKEAHGAVFKPGPFKEDETIAMLKKLQEAVKVSGVVTKQERDLIVKAIGLKAGHWFKCPNGHFYCIGECGGAMEKSRCVECGAQIGGTNHKLNTDNAHAPEMDGSSFAAWSDQYNNMANFDLE